jgi:hypothetical protein
MLVCQVMSLIHHMYGCVVRQTSLDIGLLVQCKLFLENYPLVQLGSRLHKGPSIEALQQVLSGNPLTF